MTAPLAGNNVHGLVVSIRSPSGLWERYIKNDYGFHSLSGISTENGSADAHFVKVPGTPPVNRTEEELKADGLEGRRWQNTATVFMQRRGVSTKPSWRLFGRGIKGYIYCDDAGGRWSVYAGFANVPFNPGEPLTGTITLETFGEFHNNHQRQDIEVTLDDIGQTGQEVPGVSVVFPQHMAISPDGRKAIFAFTGTQGAFLPHQIPLGWLQLEINGTPPNATAELKVLKDRDSSLGVVVERESGEGFKPYTPTLSGSAEIVRQDTPSPDRPDRVFDVVQWTPASLVMVEVPESPPVPYEQSPLVGSSKIEVIRDNVVLGMYFSEEGFLVEHKVSVRETLDISAPQFSGSGITGQSHEVSFLQGTSETQDASLDGVVSAALSREFRVGKLFEFDFDVYVDGQRVGGDAATVTFDEYGVESYEYTGGFSNYVSITYNYGALESSPVGIGTATTGLNNADGDINIQLPKRPLDVIKQSTLSWGGTIVGSRIKFDKINPSSLLRTYDSIFQLRISSEDITDLVFHAERTRYPVASYFLRKVHNDTFVRDYKPISIVSHSGDAGYEPDAALPLAIVYDGLTKSMHVQYENHSDAYQIVDFI